MSFINRIKIIKLKRWESSQLWDKRNQKKQLPKPLQPQEKPLRRNGPKEDRKKRKILMSF